MRVAGLGEGGQFAGHVIGLGRADPLEDLQRLPQDGLGPGGVAGSQGAAAQADQLCLSASDLDNVPQAGSLRPELLSRPRLYQRD
jgi:hypothetical protein